MTSVINSSVSKQQYSIPKSSRFPEIKVYSKNLSSASLEQMSDFDSIVRKGKGKERYSFGSRIDRFSTLGAVQSP